MNKRDIPITLFIAIALLISISVGMLYNGEYNTASSFYPAAGFYIGFYAIHKNRALPGILLGTIITIPLWLLIGSAQDPEIAFFVSSITILIIFMEIFIYEQLTRYIHLDVTQLRHLNQGLKFTFIAIIISIVSAILSTFTIDLIYGATDIIDTFARFAVGKFLGIMIFGNLIFDTFFKDEPRIISTVKEFILSFVFIGVFAALIIFVYTDTGNHYINLENFGILILVLYIYSAYRYQYRMILFLNLIFLILVYAFHIQFVSVEDYTLASVTNSIYIFAISSIAVMAKNLLQERKESYDGLERAKENLERVMLATNKVLNVDNSLPEDVEVFPRRYIIDMFQLAVDIYPKFTHATCYIKGDDEVEFIAAYNYDLDFINELEFQSSGFNWSYYKPLIEKQNSEHIMSENKSMDLFYEHYGRLKESMRFTVKLGDNIYAGMSFDIMEASKETFDSYDLDTFTTFQVLVNSYYQVATLNSENNTLKDDIIRSSVRTLELFDSYTESHSDQVSKLCIEIGRGLNLSQNELRKLYWSALVHDIGKIGLKPKILNKKTQLTDAEFDHIRSHSTLGYSVLIKSKGLEEIANIVRSHHERWDGSGYPDKLVGHEIPYLAQIIHVCDAVSAMASDRVYSKGKNETEILNELIDGVGKQFSPKIAKFMIDYIRDGKLTIFLNKIKK